MTEYDMAFDNKQEGFKDLIYFLKALNNEL